MNTLYAKAEKRIKELREEANKIEEVLAEPRLNDWLEGVVSDLKLLFPSWDISELDPSISVSYSGKICIDLPQYSADVSYDDMLNKPNTGMSYSGDAITFEFKETLLFRNIEATASFSAKVPESDRDFLKLMNKIVEDTQTTLHSVC